MEHVRLHKTAAAILAICLVVGPVQAGDLNKGYSFAPLEKNITNTKLNNLVDLATINTTFYTDKSAVGTPNGADLVLLYSTSAAGFRKCSVDQLIFSNSGLITAQNEDLAPTPDDFLFEFNAGAGSLAKATLNSLVFTNDALINARANWATPDPLSTMVLAYDNTPAAPGYPTNSYYKLSRSNLFYNWWAIAPLATNGGYNLTNSPLLSLHTAPTNADMLLIWDAANATNKAITLAGLMTNRPTVTTYTNSDLIPFFSTATNAANPFGTNPILAKMTLAGLFTNPPATGVLTNTDTFLLWSTATNGPAGTNGAGGGTLSKVSFPTIATNIARRFVSAEFSIVAGLAADTAHGLGAVPTGSQWVLVCKTAELGYSIGDEVDVLPSDQSSDQNFNAGKNATNIFVIVRQTGTIRLLNKTTGVLTTTLNTANWRLKGYASYLP
jgi:hypothetical protein